MKFSYSVLVMVAALAMAMPAQAALNYTFDSGAQGFTSCTWSPTGPAGWSGGASIRALGAGGWAMGSPYHEFDWQSGDQTQMQQLANTGAGQVAFDLIVDGTSFPAATGVWFQLNIAANSDNTGGGWTQKENLLPATNWHNADDATLVTKHVEFSFADLGWAPGDTWFQLYFGSNTNPGYCKFYVDNITLTPEPATMSLLVLGGLAILRRRHRA
jgi:hypothetical protein